MSIEKLKNAHLENNILTWDGELIMEGSFGDYSIGEFHNQMEFEDDGDGYGHIIWNYGKDAADEDEVVIGLNFDDNGEDTVIDYDGVMSFPLPAVVLLEALGYNCDDVKN